MRGYHIYKDIWEANVGEELPCQRESGNRADPFAVVVVMGRKFRDLLWLSPPLALTSSGSHLLWLSPPLALTSSGSHLLWLSPPLALTSSGSHLLWLSPPLALTCINSLKHKKVPHHLRINIINYALKDYKFYCLNIFCFVSFTVENLLHGDYFFLQECVVPQVLCVCAWELSWVKNTFTDGKLRY